MSWLKKQARKVSKKLGISSHDLGAIALSPFTAGASLLGTSSAKSMMKNPGGTLSGALSGFETAGPIGALLGGIEGGGGFDAMFSHGGSGAKAADDAIQQQYRYNLALQQQNQKWQTGMANTAHQREVADLKAAGLNPVLSAGGSGAALGTPGGGSVGMPDAVSEKTAEMQNKIAKGTLMNEILNGIAQRQLAGSQGAKNQADIMNETKMTNANVIKALAEAGVSQKTIDYITKHGVFPGATTTTSQSTPWGSSSETTPIGLITENTDKPNSAKEQAKKAKERQESKYKERKDTQKYIDKFKEETGYYPWWAVTGN